jgi:acyl-CoA thioester hydrolase
MSPPELLACEVELKVPFHDVDAMQVVWHGHYLKYFEIARGTLFELAGIDLMRYYATSGYLFPVVRTMVKHVHPLRYRDRFTCSARVVEIRRKIAVGFEIRLAGHGTLCARGRSEQVAVATPDFRIVMEIPEEVRRAFGERGGR